MMLEEPQSKYVCSTTVFMSLIGMAAWWLILARRQETNRRIFCQADMNTLVSCRKA